MTLTAKVQTKASSAGLWVTFDIDLPGGKPGEGYFGDAHLSPNGFLVMVNVRKYGGARNLTQRGPRFEAIKAAVRAALETT